MPPPASKRPAPRAVSICAVRMATFHQPRRSGARNPTVPQYAPRGRRSVRAMQAIAARFGAPVAFKLSAQAAPVIGAAGGAAVNLAFLEHFRGIARAHFTVRRLERRHGPALVRAAYERLRDGAVLA